jgi:hypothetical protein
MTSRNAFGDDCPGSSFNHASIVLVVSFGDSMIKSKDFFWDSVNELFIISITKLLDFVMTSFTTLSNLDRQLDSLKAAGVEEIIQEKITGTKADRPELNRLIDKLRKNDVILVADLTRLSRSTKDLFSLVDKIEKKAGLILQRPMEN